MVYSGKRLLYLGKGGCFRIKLFYLGKSSFFFWATTVVIGQSGCIRDMWLYSEKSLELGKSGCIWAKWLYSGSSGCIRAKSLYSGKGGCLRAK